MEHPYILVGSCSCWRKFPMGYEHKREVVCEKGSGRRTKEEKENDHWRWLFWVAPLVSSLDPLTTAHWWWDISPFSPNTHWFVFSFLNIWSIHIYIYLYTVSHGISKCASVGEKRKLPLRNESHIHFVCGSKSSQTIIQLCKHLTVLSAYPPLPLPSLCSTVFFPIVVRRHGVSCHWSRWLAHLHPHRLHTVQDLLLVSSQGNPYS